MIWIVLIAFLLYLNDFGLRPKGFRFKTFHSSAIKPNFNIERSSTTKLSVVSLNEGKAENKHVLALNSYKSTLNFLIDLDDSNWRPWTYRPLVNECFAATRKCRVGREKEIKDIWAVINSPLNCENNQSICYYIHGSPGMGKSYILQELMRKNINDTKHISQEIVDNTMFIALDFGSDTSNRIADFSRCLSSWDPSLLPLLRVLQQEFLCDYGWRVLIGTIIEIFKMSPDAKQKNTELIMNTIRGLLTAKCALLGHKYIVLLVDELAKSAKLSAKSPGLFQSAICSWSDSGSSRYFAHLTVFSALDRELILQEGALSGRPVVAATTLPLFSLADSVSYLEQLLSRSFYDSNGPLVDRTQAMEFLAHMSSGHPRSLEFITGHCYHSNNGTLVEVTIAAASALSAAYPDELWEDAIKLALLGETLPLTYKVSGTKETVQSLVRRGMLLGSLDNSDTVIKPILPVMYLYWFSQLSAEEPEDSRHANFEQYLAAQWMESEKPLLRQLLMTRRDSSPSKRVTFYNTYEQLMRFLRGRNYDRRPLYELYGRDAAVVDATHRSPLTKLLVDGKARLNCATYLNGTDIVLQPNDLYHSEGTNNPVGWDTLIIYEAFLPKRRATSKSNGNKYLLPVFIHDNVSDNDWANNTIEQSEVEPCLAHCRAFLNDYCTCTPGYQLIPLTNDDVDPFVLVYMSSAKAKHAGDEVDTAEHAPTNVLTLYEEDLTSMYGPTLARFVDGLLPEQDIRVARDTNIAY